MTATMEISMNDIEQYRALLAGDNKAIIDGINNTKSDVKVYVCKGPNAKRYHKTPNCRGLKKCSVVIKKVSRTEAIDMGRTPCKRCY